MKKFKLTVAQPCHEEWHKMTPDQQGRFCASCQKTVVDFTNMSDRQVLEYFKKPKEFLCGRFHNDQLNRPFVAPKKRLLWVKYFFQFTWPAFVLLLKSCGQRMEVVGKTQVKEHRTTESSVTMGLYLPQITPVDTIRQEVIEKMEVVGELAVEVIPDSEKYVTGKALPPIDSIENDYNANIDSSALQLSKVDTSGVQFDNDTLRNVTLGMVAVCTKGKRPLPSTQSELVPRTESTKPEFLVYPNPITAGQKLKVNARQKTSGYFQVLSISGQVMHFGKVNVDAKQTFDIEIKSWPAGNYVLQLVDESTGKSSTQKFIVQ